MAEPTEPTEPPGTPSTPRSPFNPLPLAPSPRTGGRGKPLVIGCLAVLVLAGVGLIVSLYYVSQSYDKIFAWSLNRVRDGIQDRLPRDLSAEARQRLDAAFTTAQAAAGSIKGNPAAAQRLQRLMLDLAHESEGNVPLTPQQVEEITHTLEQIGEIGKSGPPPASATPPARSALPGALERVST